MRKSSNNIITLIVMMVVTIQTIIQVIPVYANSEVCSDVFVLFARGSDQKQGELETQPQTNSFFKEITNRSPAGVDVHTEELIYPARGGWNHYVEAEWGWARIGDYRASVEEGINNTVNLLNQQVNECPDQKIILGGYSQGAQVMGDALYQLSDQVGGNIVYVALFGDPKFKPDSFAARGDFERRSGGILEPRAEEFPLKFRNKTYSWCKKYDGICENNLLLEIANGSDHPTYQDREIPMAANEAAILLNQYYPGFNVELLDATEKLSALDVMVVFNTSRYVERYSRSIRSGDANIWVDHLMGLSQSTRIGLADYTHSAVNIGIARTVGDLTSDKYEVLDKLSAVRSGKYTPHANETQPVFSGLMEAIENQVWRPEAHKAIFYIERVLPMDPEYNPELDTTYVQAQVLEAARANTNGPIAVYPFYTDVAPGHFLAKHKEIADGTGGRLSFYRGVEHSMGYLHLKDALTKLKLDPLPIMLGPYSWRPGVPAILSVGKMTHPRGMFTKYEWDFNNDGIYDTETQNSVAIHTYENNYHGEAWVRLSTSSDPSQNEYSYVKIQMDVDASNTILQKPSQPRRITSSATAANMPSPLTTVATVGYSLGSTTQNIKLTWQSPLDDGGSAVEGYAVYGNNELLGVTPASHLEAVINNAPLDAIFSVAAVNAAGIGESAGVESTPVEETEEPDPETTSSDSQVQITPPFTSTGGSATPPAITQMPTASFTGPEVGALRFKDAGVVLGEETAKALVRFNWWLLLVFAMSVSGYVYIRRNRKFHSILPKEKFPLPVSELS